MKPTGFLKVIIETKGDAHDFFPYQDFVADNQRKPTESEIIEYIDSFVDTFDTSELNAATQRNRAHIATLSLVINKYKTDEQYRARARRETIDYVMDADWNSLLEIDE